MQNLQLKCHYAICLKYLQGLRLYNVLQQNMKMGDEGVAG